MAVLNKVPCEPFSPWRYSHQSFIYQPRTIDTLFSVQRDEMHRMAAGFEDHAFENAGGSETSSAEGNRYFWNLFGA